MVWSLTTLRGVVGGTAARGVVDADHFRGFIAAIFPATIHCIILQTLQLHFETLLAQLWEVISHQSKQKGWLTHPESIHGLDGSASVMLVSIAYKPEALAQPRDLVHHDVHRQNGAVSTKEQIEVPVNHQLKFCAHYKAHWLTSW